MSNEDTESKAKGDVTATATANVSSSPSHEWITRRLLNEIKIFASGPWDPLPMRLSAFDFKSI